MSAPAHVPLAVKPHTPSVIVTARGDTVSIGWFDNKYANPYEEGEEFAAHIVHCVNTYPKLVEALEATLIELEASLEEFGTPDLSHLAPDHPLYSTWVAVTDARTALSLAKGAK